VLAKKGRWGGGGFPLESKIVYRKNNLQAPTGNIDEKNGKPRGGKHSSPPGVLLCQTPRKSFVSDEKNIADLKKGRTRNAGKKEGAVGKQTKKKSQQQQKRRRRREGVCEGGEGATPRELKRPKRLSFKAGDY